MTSRRTLTALGSAGALVLLAACGGDGDDETSEGDFGLVAGDGTLTACTNAPYVPFEYEDAEAPSGYSGFDIDLLQAIADELDLDLTVNNVSFEALQSGTAMAAGQCDVAASAITITPEREENLAFADPYYDSLQSLLVPDDSGVTTLGDLGGARIGVQAATTGRSYAEENAPRSAELVDFPTDGELWPALQAGQVDAVLQDLPVNIAHVQRNEGYSVVEEYATDEQYGFAFDGDVDEALVDAFNDALQALHDNGTYDEIYDSYFAADAEVVDVEED